ncbi:ovulation prohormone, partial [Biomphalaria pfeifferi]
INNFNIMIQTKELNVFSHVTMISIVGVAFCLLSSLNSQFVAAMSVHAAASGDRRTNAAIDKDMNKIMASGGGLELMEIPQSPEDETYARAPNSVGKSEEDDFPVDDSESVYAHDKSRLFQNNQKLRFNKRYRLRTSKRRLRFQKKKQPYGDDSEYGRPEDSGSAYERDLREPRLRFHAHDVRKRSTYWGDAAEDLDREQFRQRRSSPLARLVKRVPISNDLQALADLLFIERQKQAYSALKAMLDEAGKR